MEALRGADVADVAPSPAGASIPATPRRKTLLLLTDGQPNINPPRGVVAEVLDYKDKYPDFQFQLNTFGFGYDLNSELLVNLVRLPLPFHPPIPSSEGEGGLHCLT
jgi:hypothetical protein